MSTTPTQVAHDPAGKIMSHDILSSSDVLKPEIMAKVFLSYGDEGKDQIFFKNMGFEYQTSNEEYSHFQKGYSHVKATVENASAGASAGASVTYSITDSQTGGTGSHAGTVYPRVGEIVMFSNTGNTQGIITAVAQPTSSADGTFTVKPLNGATLPAVTSGGTISATVAENEIIIISGSSGEASGIIEPAISYLDKFTGNVMIIKEKVSETGTALSDATWVTLSGSEVAGGGFWSQQLIDGERRLLNKMDGAFWHGLGQDAMDGITDPTSEVSSDYTYTKGLLPTIDDMGMTDTYSFASSLADFTDWAGAFDAQFVPRSTPIWFKMGKSLSNDLETLISGKFGTTDQTYLEKTTNEKLYKTESLGVNLNFSYVQQSQRTFLFDTNMAWTNPQMYGAKGFKFNEMGVMIPVKKVRDVKTGEMFSTVGTRYKGLGSYSRKMMVGKLSGFMANISGEQITNEIDSTKYVWGTNFGAQFAEVNSMLKVTKA